MRRVTQAVEKLEEEFAAWLGAQGAVATGFGRSALRLALEAIPVRGGDVLVPDFICAQVPEAVRHAGGQPVFFPVRRDLTVDPADFEAAFTPQTRAAIAAHYFGRLLPGIERLAAVCRERGVPLVEDAALALEAVREGGRAGAFGVLAVFSLSKSDWCYGGGMVASSSPEMLGRLRALREEDLREYRWLSYRYGLLRRADFLANRPTWSRAAERAGRWLERLSGADGGNFYDAGRFDAALPEFAAARARRVLAGTPAATKRRQQVHGQLTKSLGGANSVLFRTQPEAGDAGSFLLLVCAGGGAEQWIEWAASEGVTLRRCWPAYQEIEGLAASRNLDWLAEHLLILEIHPQLAAAEIGRMKQTILRLLGE
jgi:dTDP-4-amino-4,6-dideoxygalactose transaminase